MPRYVSELRDAIKKITPVLEKMGDEATRRRPEPGKWSPREIIGHLIDSASNNHQRFVRSQFQDDLVFPGDEPTTLDYFMADYVAHLEHHLRQIVKPN